MQEATKEHRTTSMNPSCQQGTVQAGGDSIIFKYMTSSYLNIHKFIFLLQHR
uniref:Uncharacterized protein n=1 Tax=Astyanax mexicanus TaxID=7994 RepID=A0A3B1JCG0_ASTMX